jgi:hypothetical protein
LFRRWRTFFCPLFFYPAFAGYISLIFSCLVISFWRFLVRSVGFFVFPVPAVGGTFSPSFCFRKAEKIFSLIFNGLVFELAQIFVCREVGKVLVNMCRFYFVTICYLGLKNLFSILYYQFRRQVCSNRSFAPANGRRFAPFCFRKAESVFSLIFSGLMSKLAQVCERKRFVFPTCRQFTDLVLAFFCFYSFFLRFIFQIFLVFSFGFFVVFGLFLALSNPL